MSGGRGRRAVAYNAVPPPPTLYADASYDDGSGSTPPPPPRPTRGSSSGGRGSSGSGGGWRGDASTGLSPGSWQPRTTPAGRAPPPPPPRRGAPPPPPPLQAPPPPPRRTGRGAPSHSRGDAAPAGSASTTHQMLLPAREMPALPPARGLPAPLLVGRALAAGAVAPQDSGLLLVSQDAKAPAIWEVRARQPPAHLPLLLPLSPSSPATAAEGCERGEEEDMAAQRQQATTLTSYCALLLCVQLALPRLCCCWVSLLPSRLNTSPAAPTSRPPSPCGSRSCACTLAHASVRHGWRRWSAGQAACSQVRVGLLIKQLRRCRRHSLAHWAARMPQQHLLRHRRMTACQVLPMDSQTVGLLAKAPARRATVLVLVNQVV